MKLIPLIIVALLVITVGCASKKPLEKEPETMEEAVVQDIDVNLLNASMKVEMLAMQYSTLGSLRDVANGTASGIVRVSFDGEYYLYASFDNLQDPKGSDFYEGWIVRDKPFSVISTGRLEKSRRVWRNLYSSKNDLTDHTKYILTVEPDDGNPAPADHVLEGTLGDYTPPEDPDADLDYSEDLLFQQ